MKIVEFIELPDSVKSQLKAANLFPVILTGNNGSKLRGYLVDNDNVFWGVKIEVKKLQPEKK